MIAVLQRVRRASVTVDTRVAGEIGPGLLALVAVHGDDTMADVNWMGDKIVSLRIFPDGDKNFDQSVQQVGGGVLLVSNFTVAARTRQGRRPSLDDAAAPAVAAKLFADLVARVTASGVRVGTGEFGADMCVDLANDGPVTLIVDSRHARG